MSKLKCQKQEQESKPGFWLLETKSSALAVRRLVLAASLLSVCLGQVLPTLASPYPGSGAPLFAARQVQPEGDPANPFSYPFLLNIAESLARQNGFPYFLGLDGKAGPGIDLRMILLYKAGILKSPVLLPTRKKKEQAQPTYPSLSMSSIPESTGEMPSLSPKISAATVDTAAPGDQAAAENAGALRKAEAPAENSSLRLDFSKFSTELAQAGMKNELTTKVTPEMESIAMAPPLLVEIPGNVTESSFRFWTVPPSAASPKTGESTNPYEGSFVMMSPSGLKAIEGRVFFLNSGHILAYSKAKSIVIVTAVARVSVEPGAAAYVEIVKPGLTRVRVLECKKGEHGVSVKFKTGGKAEEIRLSADEDLLTAEHKLDDSDKSLQAKSSSGAGTTGGGDNWSKTNFSMKSLFDSNQFFSTDLQCQNAEQRSAIMQLRKRIK